LTVVTVKKVGRPSEAEARRRQILAAMRVVAGRDGLHRVTVSSVAEAAGLQRTLVFHYFRDRRSLVDAFIADVVAAYGDRQVLGGSGDLAHRLDAAFEDGFYESAADLAIWQELIAWSARDAGIRARLHSLWTDRWLPGIEQRLRDVHPSASDERVAQVAYTLACLIEAHWALAAQGVADARRTRALQAAARDALTFG
jgi:AcrR family transcriptional regulator